MRGAGYQTDLCSMDIKIQITQFDFHHLYLSCITIINLITGLFSLVMLDIDLSPCTTHSITIVLHLASGIGHHVPLILFLLRCCSARTMLTLIKIYPLCAKSFPQCLSTIIHFLTIVYGYVQK